MGRALAQKPVPEGPRVYEPDTILMNDCVPKNQFVGTILKVSLKIAYFYDHWHSIGFANWLRRSFLTVCKRHLCTSASWCDPTICALALAEARAKSAGRTSFSLPNNRKSYSIACGVQELNTPLVIVLAVLTCNFKQKMVSASKICPTFISLTLYVKSKLTNSLYRIVKQAYLGFH